MNENVCRALKWIVGKLDGFRVEYQFTGGLAAYLYGSKREIYDIDIEVRDSVVWFLADECNDYVVYGPCRYLDDNFDLLLMTLDYGGQLIDVCGVDNMSIRGSRQVIDFSESCIVSLFGMDMKLCRKEDLVVYKKLLGRDVDLVDVGLLENSFG
jgi:hypothetical protein